MTSRGVKCSGRLVRLLREAPDQLLEDRTHDMVGHHLGVQVYLGEAADHLVQQVGLVEFLNLFGKFKTLDKNLAGVIREAFNIAGDIGGNMAWIVLESIEAEPADVVQGNASDAVEEVEVPDLATCRLSYLVSTCCLVESRTQSRRLSTVNGRTTLPYSDCL